MSMHIAGVEVNFTHKALEVFVSGCTRNCPGCHNPELQKYGVGKKWQRWIRENAYRLQYDYSMLVNKLWIVGGDLLCQPPEDVVEFLKALRKAAPSLQLIVWTGEQQLKNIDDDVKALVDGFKLGPYKEGLGAYSNPYIEPDGSTSHIELASLNQFFVFMGDTKYGEHH